MTPDPLSFYTMDRTINTTDERRSNTYPSVVCPIGSPLPSPFEFSRGSCTSFGTSPKFFGTLHTFQYPLQWSAHDTMHHLKSLPARVDESSMSFVPSSRLLDLDHEPAQLYCEGLTVRLRYRPALPWVGSSNVRRKSNSRRCALNY